MKKFFVLVLVSIASFTIYASNLYAYCGAENQAVASAQMEYDSALERVRSIKKN